MKMIIGLCLLVASISYANRESGGRNGVSAVYVEFRSFGTGIDQSALQTYQQLAWAAKSRGEVITSKTLQKSREGELLHCVLLKDAYQRHNFVSSLAFSIKWDTKLVGRQRTHVYVGSNCDDVTKATLQDISKY